MFPKQNSEPTNTGGGFGQQQATGTAVVKYKPVGGTDVVVKSGTSTYVYIEHHCISFLKEYQSKSLEELRLEDYVAGRKGPSGVFGFQQTENKPLFGGTSTFGQRATTSAPSLFGPSIRFTPVFGHTNTFSFGGGAQTNTQTMGLFGSNKPAFGATPTPGTGLFAATTTQAPAFGTNTSSFGFGANTQNQSGGLFNNKPASSEFSTTPSTSFGDFGAGLFAETNTTEPTFGTTTPAFGSTGFGTNTTDSNLFGNNTFGKPPTSQPSFDFNTQSALVNHCELQVKILTGEKKTLESELHDREKEVKKLQAASEKLNSKYQELQNRHEIDSAVIQKVMQQAGEWHQQVTQLKRKNTALMLALPTAVELVLDLDATDAVSETSGNEEVEFLKRIISEMSEQVAALQTEAKTAKLRELEAQESIVQLAQELETEEEKCAEQAKELQELRNRLKRHNRVSKLLMEMSELNIDEDKDRQMAETKPVIVQKHQSALLLGEQEVDERLGLLLGEMDALRDARQQQQKTAEKHEDTDVLLSEEKTILAEEDVQMAQEVVEELKVEPEPLQEPTPTPPPSPTSSAPAPPPPLPPPPPANKGASLKKTKQNEGGAMDAIVDQTKGVTFQLKSTDQNSLEKPKDDQPGGREGGAANIQHIEGNDESEE